MSPNNGRSAEGIAGVLVMIFSAIIVITLTSLFVLVMFS